MILKRGEKRGKNARDLHRTPTSLCVIFIVVNLYKFLPVGGHVIALPCAPTGTDEKLNSGTTQSTDFSQVKSADS